MVLTAPWDWHIFYPNMYIKKSESSNLKVGFGKIQNHSVYQIISLNKISNDNSLRRKGY